MESIQTDQVLRDTGELLKAYGLEYPRDSREELLIDKEFRLFVQLHFIRNDDNPLDSSPSRIDSFLNPSIRLPLFKIRQTAILRFFGLQKKK